MGITTPTLEAGDGTFDSSTGLQLHVTLRGESAIFRDFFEGYDRAFVLPDEKEDAAGFRRCLELNHGAAYTELAQRYGEFREVCLVAYDAATGARAGGANFIATPHGGCITANLNYIYIDASARRSGYFGRLTRAVRELIQSLFPAHGAALVFIEQNDPFAMSPEAYARDTQFTALDQFDRLRIWAKVGARVVDFAYVQPALSDEQQPDDTLVYSVYGSERTTLSPEILREHLRRFFGISVRKGAPLDADACASQQLETLLQLQAANAEVALIDPRELLERLRTQDKAALWADAPTSFRDALRR